MSRGLGDVYKRQEEIRELVPEAKPSLMDRLKADKPEHEARQMIPPVPERER